MERSPFDRVIPSTLPDRITTKADIPVLIDRFKSACSDLGLTLKHGSPVWQLVAAAEKLDQALMTGTADRSLLNQAGDFFWLNQEFESNTDRPWLKSFVHNLKNHERFTSALLELRCASIARATGWKVQGGEPDLILSIFGERLGVACKRPRSQRALAARFGDAVEQIEKSGIDGIVVLDLSLVANGDYRYPTPGKWHLQVQARMLELVKEHAKEFENKSKGKRVSALILRLGECIIVGNVPPFVSYTMDHYLPVEFRRTKPWIFFDNTLKSCYEK